MHHGTAVRATCLALAALGLTACSSRSNDEAKPPAPTTPAEAKPGADGVGDPYYPKDGNGGYDVAGYHVSISYDPKSHRLDGDTEVTAKATGDLQRFNLDLNGMKVAAVEVDGKAAKFERAGEHELVITPAAAVADGARFTTRVKLRGRAGARRGGQPRRERLAALALGRRVRGGRAALGERLVPGERHAPRQGDVQAGRAGAERLERDLERDGEAGDARLGRVDDVPLGGADPDRDVPDDDRYRQVDFRPVEAARAGCRW